VVTLILNPNRNLEKWFFRKSSTFCFYLFLFALSTFFSIKMKPLHAENQFTVFHYASSDYKGSNQNWDISKDTNGRIFIANNSGLLVFDGSRTRLFEMNEKTLLRSVACIDDKVYTGSFEEFGYWQETENGDWIYTSLVPRMKENVFQNDEIWKIVPFKDKVYFQSFGNIFCFDQKEVTSLKLPGPVLFLLKSSDRIFTQAINGGLFEIVEDRLEPIPGSEIFSSTEIKTILQPENGPMIIGTGSMGLFQFDGERFTEWKTEASDALKQFKINNGIVLGNNLVFGTILKGLFVLDYEGHLLHHIHSGNGLQNNTVLALQGDKENNVWAGLDKGFDFVWFHSPIDTYRDVNMEAGSVYTAALQNNELYVGTNQGIYYYQISKSGKFYDRKLIQNSQGQVWFMKVLEDKLYCGLNDGTYIVENHRLTKISDINGGYNLKQIQTTEKDILLQSTYTEIAVFEKTSGIWIKNRTLKGYNAPTRYLEMDHLGNIFLGHSITGLYLLQASAGFDQVIHQRKLGFDEGLTFKTNRVFKVDNRVVVPSGNEFYQWDALSGSFEVYDDLNNQLGSFASSETVIHLGNNKYWFIKPNEMGMFEIHFGKAKLFYRLIPEMFDLNMVEQYENIVVLNDSLQLICLEDGFAVLNLNTLSKIEEVVKPPEIVELLFWRQNDQTEIFNREDARKRIQLSHRYNNFSASFAAPETAGRRNYFQTYLEGIDNKWSEWNTLSRSEYTRLPPGKYVFKVRGLTVRGMLTPETIVYFHINPPWFLAWYSFLGYSILLLLFVLLLWNNYRRRQWKKQEQFLRDENEKMKARSKQAEAELFKVSNEKLQSEITTKNMELAKNTMAMIKKNELLIEIRKELENQKEELGFRLPSKYFSRINKLIESSINSEHDWEMFEHLFDQAHENFFRRLKQDYSDLTTSDFRLCAYLRMNLASKEIAPLLNISIRGVEEKRYRLRKKFNLLPEQNLTEFIINF